MDEEKLEQRVQSLRIKSHHSLAAPATEIGSSTLNAKPDSALHEMMLNPTRKNSTLLMTQMAVALSN